MILALEDLQKADEVDVNNKNVWLSGGYMSLAEMLRSDDPEAAKTYLAKAKEFITDDPRLAVRLKQWKALKKILEGGEFTHI